MNSDLNSKFELNSHVAVVTGGGRGIGRAIAQALAEAGAKVAVLARTGSELEETVELIESSGGVARAWRADVTDAARIREVVKEVEGSLGPITILVNNAGRGMAGGPIWETDQEEWWRDVEVNLKGPFLCSSLVLPGMITRRQGTIINISSYVGVRATPDATAYACSKAALLRLTDSVAMSVKEYGVTVFAVSPGWVWTRMTERVVEQLKANDPTFEGIPESQVHSAEEGARLVVRLCTGEADLLTGRFIHVVDDLDAMLADAEKIIADDLYALRLNKIEA